MASKTTPDGYWTIERAIEKIKECTSSVDYEKKFPGGYNVLLKYKMTHLLPKLRPNKKPAGYWDDKQHCIDACKDAGTIGVMHKKYRGACDAIRKYGWEDECYQYLQKFRVKEYTLEQLEVIALKHKTYKEFRLNDAGAYEAAKNKGILEEICQHMPELRKNKVYDDKPDYDSCKERAKNYSSRSEFQHKDNRYYTWAHKHGILDDICSHMLRRGNKKKRCIYAAEFSDHCAYVGLTYFAERRWSDHLREDNSGIKRHIDETGLTPTFKRLTDYMDYQEASIQEGVWKEKYDKDGWFILNIAKTGSLGGDTGYTLDEVLAEASKYEMLSEFFKGSPGYYQRAYREGWMEQVRAICKSTWHGGYTEQELRDIFAMFDCLKDVRKYRHAAVDAAYKMGLIEELTKDYIIKPKKRYVVDRFTEDELMEIARPFIYKSEFMKANPKAYRAAHRKGIIDKVCAHMIKKPMHRKELSIEEIFSIAAGYDNRTGFLKHAPLAAKRAKELGIYDKVCAHMRDAHWKYTTNEAIEIAKGYKGRTELFNGDRAAFKRLEHDGLLDELLPKLPNYNFKWTDEARREAAAQCKNRKEFQEKFPQALAITREKKDWNIIAPHLAKDRWLWTEEIIAERCRPYHNMKELKIHDYECWNHCMNKPDKRRIAEKYFRKD